MVAKIDLESPCALISHENWKECLPCGLPYYEYRPGIVKAVTQDGVEFEYYSSRAEIWIDSSYYDKCMDSLSQIK